MSIVYLSDAPVGALPPGVVQAAERGFLSGLKLRRQSPEAAICASPAQQSSGPWPQIGMCASPEDAYRYRPGTHLVTGTRACASQLAAKGRTVICLPMPLADIATPLPVAPPHLLVAAPFTRASCLDLVLKAVAGIADLTITLAGQGASKGDLEELAQRLGVRSKFTKFATADDYRAATLMLHPVRSDWEGSAIRAAHAAARPLIATATEAARELITPNETGLMIPIADVEALAHSIRLLIEDRHLAESLARAGHEFHQRDFSQQLLNSRWQRYLGEIIKPPPAAPKERFNVRRV